MESASAQHWGVSDNAPEAVTLTRVRRLDSRGHPIASDDAMFEDVRWRHGEGKWIKGTVVLDGDSLEILSEEQVWTKVIRRGKEPFLQEPLASLHVPKFKVMPGDTAGGRRHTIVLKCPTITFSIAFSDRSRMVRKKRKCACTCSHHCS